MLTEFKKQGHNSSYVRTSANKNGIIHWISRYSMRGVCVYVCVFRNFWFFFNLSHSFWQNHRVFSRVNIIILEGKNCDTNALKHVQWEAIL